MSTERLSFRRAVAADVPAVTGLVQAAYLPYAERTDREPAPMLAYHEAAIDEGELWLASEGDRLVGVLELRPAAGYLLLENVAVAPAAQGRGLGRRLLDLADERARSLGLSEVRLFTNVAMTENQDWYLRRGFTETHRGVEAGYHRVHYARPVTGPGGASDLAVLLADLRPRRHAGEWVFATVAEVPAGITPQASFREEEGLSILVRREDADATGLAYDLVGSLVTLEVRSALDAVGLTAAVAGCLAAEGISANVIAARHHDHLLVPAVDADRALLALRRLAAEHP